MAQSESLRSAIVQAQTLAVQHNIPRFGPEYLLQSLLSDKDIARILIDAETSPYSLREDLLISLRDSRPAVQMKEGVPVGKPDNTVRHILKSAELRNQQDISNGDIPPGTPVSGLRVFLEFFTCLAPEDTLIEMLRQSGIDPDLIARHIRETPPGSAPAVSDEVKALHAPQPFVDIPVKPLPETVANDDMELKSITAYCIDLHEAALNGNIQRVIARDAEMSAVLTILGLADQSSPLIVGASGVGKTTLARGIAHRIMDNEVPGHMTDTPVFELNRETLQKGLDERCNFEDRLYSVLDDAMILARQRERIPVFILDDAELWLQAGAIGGGSLDVFDVLGPYILRGDIQCIATTSHAGLKMINQRKDVKDLFTPSFIEEATREQTSDILKVIARNRMQNHHNLPYTTPALSEAVRLSARHISGKLPKKAVTLIDHAAASLRQLPKHRIPHSVGTSAIERSVIMLGGKPIPKSSAKAIEKLGRDLNGSIFDQPQAVNELLRVAKLSCAELNDPDQPLGSFLFAGPTGVGKTEVAKQLASSLGLELLRFDMSEYMERHTVSRLIGAPPGYIGFEKGGLLTEKVDRHPHCVLLLDEIEKAHKDIYNILLQVMDHGKLTDSDGKEVDFRNVIIIMTTNAGASDMARPAYGFTRVKRVDEDTDAINQLFAPEFRNRLTASIKFSALPEKAMTPIVEKFVDALRALLKDRKNRIELNPDVVAFLIQNGYDEAMGARPMKRAVREHLTLALSEEIIAGRLKKGDTIRVAMNEAAKGVPPQDAAKLPALTFIFERSTNRKGRNPAAPVCPVPQPG